MTDIAQSNPAVSQSELLGAAPYCAVADWFESHPCVWQRDLSMHEAMDAFNRVETELRRIGAKVLRQPGHRELLLQAVGIPEEAR